MHVSLGRCGRSHLRVRCSSQRITLPFAIPTMEVPTEVTLVTARHDIFDTEAMWKCMEEGGVMWCEVVAAARAAGTSVVEHQIWIAEKRLERARQRLDEIELEKVTRRCCRASKQVAQHGVHGGPSSTRLQPRGGSVGHFAWACQDGARGPHRVSPEPMVYGRTHG